jgi:GT2 family glycosyltransferase
MITPEQQMAILIPTRDRPAILKRTLEELLKLGFGDHPLVVYDDASEDPSAIRLVVSIWPDARLLRGENRSGQAKGRNQLMRACPCEYALFLDDDSFPEERASILNALRTVAHDRLGIASFTYKALADGQLSVPPEQGRRQAASFLGGASLFNVSRVLAVGGYRECFIYGAEEPELALRLWAGGIPVEYLPGVIIIHNQFYSAEERRDYREYDYLYARNFILMSSLNMPILVGLPHGLAKSLRWSVHRKRNWMAKLSGIRDGVFQSFTRRSERHPCTLKQSLAWMRLA